ncbi:MAG: hypothetical protein ACK5XN_25805 [Bacteroidota bacterium]|jgi:hypothetical protein
MKSTFYGILASIDWNSNRWKELPTEEDLDHSNFKYVVENGITFTAINFGHEIFPADAEGNYWGLIPQMAKTMPDVNKSRYVEVVFLKSNNWRDKQNYIVGIYAFPTFEKSFQPFPFKKLSTEFFANIKAQPKNIHLLASPLKLLSKKDLVGFLPPGKQLGKQGFNYLTEENVRNILDAITQQNPSDKKFESIKKQLVKHLDKTSK